ncbi:MAG: PKD domain-containing protein [Candidatus Thermoplasmatota archaeon]|jgi:PKD repeat protein|nr:PKD domain-containing protein [Candidatus Thermoplasmatota archaeon]
MKSKSSDQNLPSVNYFNITTRSAVWSEWAGKPITIDGNPNEWIHNYIPTPVGVAGENVDLYMANSDTFLYICVDVISDITNEESADDALMFMFDGDNSNNASNTSIPYSQDDIVGNRDNWVTINGNSSSKSTSGTTAANCNNDAGYILKYPSNNTLLLIHDDNNWINDWSYKWNVTLNGSPARMVYELRIPLGQWGWSPGDTIGGTLKVFRDGDNTPIGIWPPGLQQGEANDPVAWQDFVLGTPNEKPTLSRPAATPSIVENDGETEVRFTVEAGDVDGSLSQVTIDLSEIQQNGDAEMVDDGTGGDETSGDGTYSFSTTISSSISPGKFYLPVTVTDDHTPNVGSASRNIELKVVQDNREPYFILVNETDISELNRIELTAYEDEDNIFDFTAEDDDDDLLIYSINIGEVFFDLIKGVDYQFDPATGKLEIRPKQENVGSHGLKLEVNDGREGSDTVDITLYIENSNDPPHLDDIKTQLVFQDAWLNLTPVVDDEDDYIFTFSTNFTELFEGNLSKDNFQFSNDTGDFRFKPDKNMVKKFNTYIRVEDLRGAFTREDFIIDVININDPPEYPSFNYSVEINDPAVTFTADEGTDPDNDPITYTWNFGDGTKNQSGETLMEVVHSYQSEGTFTVNLTLSDNQGFSSQLSREISVSLPKLRGTISEINVGGIPGCDIGIIRTDRLRKVINYTTGPSGEFEIPLVPGTYNITIRKNGFITQQTQIIMTSGINYMNKNLTRIQLQKGEPVPNNNTGESGGWVFCLLGVGALLFVGAVAIMMVMRRKKKMETPHPETEFPYGMRQQNQRSFQVPQAHAHAPPPYSPQSSSVTHTTPPDYGQTTMRREEALLPEKTETKQHKKPTIVTEKRAEKKEEEEKIDVIKVIRKKKDEDIQEIFGGSGDMALVPIVEEMDHEPAHERTPETAHEQTPETMEIVSDSEYSQSRSPEFADSLKNMAEILKSFSKNKD